jgi:hypothetical protein
MSMSRFPWQFALWTEVLPDELRLTRTQFCTPPEAKFSQFRLTDSLQLTILKQLAAAR